jgi:MFS family permease
MVVIFFFFKAPDRPEIQNVGWKARVKDFDLYGTAVFIPAIICLLLALQWGGTKYEWNSWRIIILFVFFGLLIGAFTFVQFWKQETATIPPKVMKMRSMWTAAYFSFALGSFFLLLVYFLPIWFQAVKGASAVKSGIMNLPMILTLVIVSIFSGIGVTVLGYCKLYSQWSLQTPDHPTYVIRRPFHDCVKYLSSYRRRITCISQARF